MADKQENVRRQQFLTRAEANTNQKTKMLGLVNDDNPSLVFKKTSGEDVFFNSEGGDATFRSAQVTNLSGTGTRNMGVDEDGNMITYQPTLSDQEYIDFLPQVAAPTYKEGREFYDDNRKTLAVMTNIEGFNLEQGRTSSTQFIADEVITIGDPLYVSSQTPGDLHVSIASNKRYNENWVIGIAGNSAILDGKVEFVQKGGISGLDTTMWQEGVPLYLGDGVIVDTRPEFPYADSVFIGANVYSHATEGAIGVSVNNDPYEVFLDGTCLERQDINVYSDGVNIYAEVWNLADDTRNLPIQLNGSIIELDSTTGAGTVQVGSARVQLIAGTTDTPQAQQVYVDHTSGVSVLKTIAEGGEPTLPYTLLADVSVLDAVSTQTDLALQKRRSSTNKADEGRGSIARIFERLSELPPQYKSGVIPTATTDGTTMLLSVIAGVVMQTRNQDFPALSVDTDNIWLSNGAGGASLDNYSKYNNLSDLMGYTNKDEARDTSSTGNLFIYGCINKDTQTCKLFAQLPKQLFSTTAASGRTVYNDNDNTTITSAPSSLRKTAFAICRIPYRLSGTSFQFLDPDGAATNSGEFIDVMLGESMGASAGSGAGGGTATPNLTQVLVEGNDAGFVQIKSMADGTLAQDAATISNTRVIDGTLNNGDTINNTTTGSNSHTEGSETTTIGGSSHAEGLQTEANGAYSHAEGKGTYAGGLSSHAEGWDTIATGQYSHSEGVDSESIADFSHAGGLGTKANTSYTTAIGRYNDPQTDSVFEVGFGTTDLLRANALVIDTAGTTTVNKLVVNDLASLTIDTSLATLVNIESDQILNIATTNGEDMYLSSDGFMRIGSNGVGDKIFIDGGEITATLTTISDINTAGAKSIITREYLQAFATLNGLSMPT